MKQYLNWNYTDDLVKLNTIIAYGHKNWVGLTSAEQIISIEKTSFGEFRVIWRVDEPLEDKIFEGGLPK